MARKRPRRREVAKSRAPLERPPSSPAPAVEPSVRPPPRVPSGHRWAARGVVVALTALAYGRGLSHGLLAGWDDDRFLIDNPLVQEASLEHLVAIFGQPRFQAYHPLHLLSYWIDVPWVGLNAPVIHAVSLGLFVLALFALLEACWALRLSWLAGLAVTLVVGLHPVQVEVVSWASGRKDILALGFASLAVLLHTRSRRPFDRAAWGSLLAYAAACLSKTTALPLPAVLVLADVWLLHRDARRALLAQAPALLVAVGLGVTTIGIWSDAQMIRGQDLDLLERVSLVGASLTHALSTLAWPSSTSPLYPIHRGEGLSWALSLAGPVVVAGALVAAWRAKLGRLAFGVATFLAFWAPASNIIPLYFQWQDRYLSLPLVGLAFLFGAGLDAVAEANPAHAKRLAIVPAMVALALTARTAQYVGVWRSDLALFGHAATTQPRSFYAWLNLGHARQRAGALEGALSAYEAAIDVKNLAVGHAAQFRTVMLVDERDRGLAPSRADAMTARFHAALSSPNDLRGVAGDLAQLGYRRSVTMCLDYSFALDPLPQPQLERAALVQLQLGNEWLADYYISRLGGPPVTPGLRARVQAAESDRADEAGP